MESTYIDLKFGIEKYALEAYVKEHLDDFGVLKANSEDEYFKLINQEIMCRILANTMYPYTREHYGDPRISTYNRIWSKQLYEMGGPIDARFLASSLSVPNLEIFVTAFRKYFGY